MITGIVKDNFGFNLFRNGKVTARGRRNKCLYEDGSNGKCIGCHPPAIPPKIVGVPYSHGSCEFGDCIQKSIAWAEDPTNMER